MKSIVNFFKAIGNFLNDAVEYFDNRVRTGKFTADIKYAVQTTNEEEAKILKRTGGKVYRSNTFQTAFTVAKKHWKRLLTIPSFAHFVSLFGDTCKLLFKFYAIIFITFALTFPSLILLLNFFDNDIAVFFYGLLPIILWNIYCLSAFYLCIEKREQGQQVSLWLCFQYVFKHILSISFITFAQFAIAIEIVVIYCITVLFFGYFFEAMGLPWGDSFIYWFIIIFLGLLLLIGIFLIIILLHQAYLVILFENKKVNEALAYGLYVLKQYASPIIFFYLLLYLFSAVLVYWASLYYLYIGFALSVYLLLQLSIFLGFLLRRRFFAHLTLPETATMQTQPTLTILILFGLINYVLGAFVITNQFQYITSTIERQRDNYFLSRKLVTYTNTLYRFMIQYPQNWADYEWRGSSVTFYNNYTGTIVGGIWLNISVSPFDEKEFVRLYEARPGLVSLDRTTNEMTTKVSNISVQGYPGVHYTFYKPDEPYPQYQTHYLIHKDQYLYRITFTTLDKDVEGNNDELFERIMSSFRFIE